MYEKIIIDKFHFNEKWKYVKKKIYNKVNMMLNIKMVSNDVNKKKLNVTENEDI